MDGNSRDAIRFHKLGQKMTYAQRELFLISLRQQFIDIFVASKASKDNTEPRLRSLGFIHAGELSEICSRQEVQQLME